MTLDLPISHDLVECFRRTETVCVHDCCGLDAFEPGEKIIQDWVTEIGVSRAFDVLDELRPADRRLSGCGGRGVTFLLERECIGAGHAGTTA